MRERFCKVFRSLSYKVWNMMSESQYYGFHRSRGNFSRGLNIGEDTITDFVLMEVCKKLPHEVIAFKFSKRFEAEEGVDWEWWILSASGILGIRLQAKKLHFINGTYIYEHLDYRRNNQYQVDKLIQYATKEGLMPLYIFYNWWDRGTGLDNLVNYTYGCRIYSPAMQGITIADAISIEQRVKQSKKEAKDVLSVSWPIHCLFCKYYSDLSESISGFLKENNRFGQGLKTRKFERLPQVVLNMIQSEEPKEDTPTYITFIIDPTEPHEDVKKVREITEQNRD